MHEEQVLYGGYTNLGLVTRVGDTVRRPLRRTSPAIHALLDHLERVGFEGAPRFLGVDERGREILSFIPGDAAIAPQQDWALTDEALVSVAELLRRYHDATRSFDARGLEWPEALPDRFRGDVICHNDPNLDNVIFTGGRAVGLIDYDLACPGSAVWDVACAVRLWAPLRDETDAPPQLRGRAFDRVALFADAYGLSRPERAQVADAVIDTFDWCYRIVRHAVHKGHDAFREMWRGGGAQRADRTRQWIQDHHGETRDALVSSSPAAPSTISDGCPRRRSHLTTPDASD